MPSWADRRAKPIVTSVAFVAAFVATGCDKETPPLTPEEQLARVQARGPWAVGVHVLELSYDDPADEAPRSLRVTVWAPSADLDGDPVEYRGLIESDGAWDEASLADGQFPLVIYSHGHQGYAESSSFLMEHLASHGLLVIAPDHTENTLFDGADRDTEIYHQRPRDLSAVLDGLSAGTLDAPGLNLSAAWDGRVLATGHSFGGYTLAALYGGVYDVAALEAACATPTEDGVCSSFDAADAEAFAAGLADPRVTGAVIMAPGDFDLFGAPGLAALQGPVVIMTGEEDPGLDGDRYWSAVEAGDARRLRLVGGGHLAFTDFSGQLESGELIEPEEGWRILNGYTLAFVLHTLGEPNLEGILDGSLSLGDAALISP
ncbi:hypothetical protein L6R49_09400 [Myxococcota bacterium]|nr:hypothetical protein [Myxococcota bacterium]